MASRGYIKIPRELFCSKEWSDKRVFGKVEAQIDLLQLASYIDGKAVECPGGTVILNRGQLLTTMRELADRWGWSPAKVCRYLQTLRNNVCNSIRIQIETSIETGRTLITICNYDAWDVSDCSDETSFVTTPETHHATENETHIIKKDINTHTSCFLRDKDSLLLEDKLLVKDKNAHIPPGVPAVAPAHVLRAYELLAWIGDNYPAVQRMPQPLTVQNVIWMLNRYSVKDVRRLIASMDNKGATKNKSAYTTFVNFARHDKQIGQREVDAGKFYSYEEFCTLTCNTGKYAVSDFERSTVNGRPMYQLKKPNNP